MEKTTISLSDALKLFALAVKIHEGGNTDKEKEKMDKIISKNREKFDAKYSRYIFTMPEAPEELLYYLCERMRQEQELNAYPSRSPFLLFLVNLLGKILKCELIPAVRPGLIKTEDVLVKILSDYTAACYRLNIKPYWEDSGFWKKL